MDSVLNLRRRVLGKSTKKFTTSILYRHPLPTVLWWKTQAKIYRATTVPREGRWDKLPFPGLR